MYIVTFKRTVNNNKQNNYNNLGHKIRRESFNKLEIHKPGVQYNFKVFKHFLPTTKTLKRVSTCNKETFQKMLYIYIFLYI